MKRHVLTRSYNDGVETISFSENADADGETNFDGSLTGADQEVDVAYTRANLKAVSLSSDKAVEIYTNAASGGAFVDHISLAAGQVKLWSLASDGLAACPFTANVTKLYVTVPAGTAKVKVRALFDVTP